MTSPNKADSRHIVAVALDDHMIYAFFVLVNSLTTTARAPFRLIVGYFTGRLSESHLSLMNRYLCTTGIDYDLRELRPNPLFTERRHLTITTFSKFVISDQVADPHLWIDLDTIARAGWDDIFPPLLEAGKDVLLVVADKIPGPHTRFDGFNAGVLGWTAAERKPWVEALEQLPEKRFSSEQHLFNTLYQSNNHCVDVRFNFLSSWHADTEELRRASIIHYSGPLKPWHLPRRHARAWRSINSSWQAWFEAETSLTQSLAGSPLERELQRLARGALRSGRLHTGKGAAAGWFLRMLSLIGPLGTPLVWWLSSRAAR